MGGFLGWLTGENQADQARDTALEISNAANAAQGKFTREAMDKYMEYLNKALEAGDVGTAKAIAMQIAGGQAALDLGAKGAAQQMSWNLPQQQASLSALQALPQMQALMGMQAYNVPTSIDTSTPGSPNLAGLYQNALTTGQGGVAAVPQTSGGVPGTTSTANLTPFTGKVMDVTASPLFKWQQQQMQENVNRDLAARGYGSSPAGASILANEYAKLTGLETDKTYNRLQDMYRSAFGQGSTGGTSGYATMAQIPSTVATNLSDIYNRAAQSRAGLYEGAGTTMAAGLTGLGAQAGALGQSQAQAALTNVGQSPLSTAIDLFKLYQGISGFGGGSRGGYGTSYLGLR